RMARFIWSPQTSRMLFCASVIIMCADAAQAEEKIHELKASHADLNEAAKIATREMINFVVSTRGLPRDDAYMLLSAAMDLQVTQVVDGTKGVHAMLAKSIFRNQ